VLKRHIKLPPIEKTDKKESLNRIFLMKKFITNLNGRRELFCHRPIIVDVIEKLGNFFLQDERYSEGE